MAAARRARNVRTSSGLAPCLADTLLRWSRIQPSSAMKSGRLPAVTKRRNPHADQTWEIQSNVTAGSARVVWLFNSSSGEFPSVLPLLRVARRGTQHSQQSTRALADPLLIPPAAIKSSLSTLRRQHGAARTTETPRYNLGSCKTTWRKRWEARQRLRFSSSSEPAPFAISDDKVAFARRLCDS